MTEEMTPEERRDAVVAAVLAAGGVVRSVVALATPDEPWTVVAYRVEAGAPTAAAAVALTQLRADTEVDASGLVPATPAPTIPDPLDEEPEDEESEDEE